MNAAGQPEGGYGLPPELLGTVFPFHLALDTSLQVIQVGATLRRICPDLQAGTGLAQVFRMIQPEGELTADWVREHSTRFYLLEHRASHLQLRGGFYFLRAPDVVFFLGSPWLTDTSEIAGRGLTFDDFAIHDPVVDMLQVFQASKIALADAKKLADRLGKQRAELRLINDRLRIREAETRTLALIAARTDNAVVLTNEVGRTVWVNEGFTRLTGYTMEEMLGRKPGEVLQGPDTDPQTVSYIREQLQKGDGFSVEVLNYAKNGRSYWLSIEVQPIRDENGRLTNFMAIERDISALRAAQQRQAIQVEVSRLLVEAPDLTAATRGVLELVCRTLGWSLGQFWSCQDDSLRMRETWHEPSISCPSFIDISARSHFGIGVGLPGRVWAMAAPAWVPDVTRDARFPRAAAAAQDGLRSAFAFPIFSRGALWGVLEFFSRRIAEPDEPLLKMFLSVGNQIGQFVARSKAEEALRRANALQRAILESANYSIISTRPDGVILTFNSAAERMLGYTSAEMLGKQTPAIIHDPEEVAARAQELSRELGRRVEPGFEAFVAKAALGMPDEREWTYVRKDGSRFPVLLSVTAIRDEANVITAYLGIASDITDRRRQADELRGAKEASEAADRAKSEFLAMMSHEIRTPMNAVIGMANLLLDTPLDLRQTEYARTVANSGEALLEIINDILDFSKIEAGGEFQLEEEAFSLRALVEQIIRLLGPRAEASHLLLTMDISADTPDQLQADDGRLRQVLLNLISNSIKFTEQGGVTIRVRPISRSEQTVRLRFEVQDTGIGMSPEALNRMFQPFSQVDSSASRRRGGTGLGLAICKRIVQRMGGCIGVDSELGRGSTFWFEVEMQWERASPEGEAPGISPVEIFAVAGPPKAGERPSRVLVAEDHDTNRRLAGYMLESLGVRADFAGNGLEAVEAWERFAYEVILMDCQMPEMDGFEATREIRKREAVRGLETERRVRIVALTANALIGDRERCVAAGMDGYLSKPFTAQQLAEALALPAPLSQVLPETCSNHSPESDFDPSYPARLWQELGAEGVRDIVQDFLEDLSKLATELPALAKAGALDELARRAHSVQGIGLSVGLLGMAQLCRELEQAAATRDAQAIAEPMKRLPTLAERGRASLADWLDQQTAGA